MHIAICDNNVADRKQLERLLDRESDRRKAEFGVFYSDCFGVGAQLIPKRMAYDMFFLDVFEGEQDGLDLALELCSEGVSAPVVLCSSVLDFEAKAQTLDELPPNIHFIRKPITVAALSAVTDTALEVLRCRERTIELRSANFTKYVHDNDIISARQSKRGVIIRLSDGEDIEYTDNIANLYSVLITFNCFVAISGSVIININHLLGHSFLSVSMKDGQKFKATLPGISDLKSVLAAKNQ